jgi:hypothetical protein
MNDKNLTYNDIYGLCYKNFEKYTSISLNNNTIPVTVNTDGLESIDLTYIIEDQITITDINYNNSVTLLLPDHIVSLFLINSNNIIINAFPQSLKRILIKNSKIKEIPKLPSHLQFLIVSHNELIELPVLPKSLLYLSCSHNKDLKYLPALSDKLKFLKCISTKISDFSYLPNSLMHLSIGGGGKDTPILIPEAFPSNLEYLRIGTDAFCYLDEDKLRFNVLQYPEDYLGEYNVNITNEMINKYIKKTMQNATDLYTKIINKNSFHTFPPKLKIIELRCTNLSSFPTKLPEIWYNFNYNDLNNNSYSVSDSISDSVYDDNYDYNKKILYIEAYNTKIHFQDLKYQNLFEKVYNISNIAGIQMQQLFNIDESDKRDYLDSYDILQILQYKNHASFNVAVFKKSLIPKLKDIDPYISQYLSNNKTLQNKTKKNIKGGCIYKNRKQKKIKTLKQRNRNNSKSKNE